MTNKTTMPFLDGIYAARSLPRRGPYAGSRTALQRAKSHCMNKAPFPYRYKFVERSAQHAKLPEYCAVQLDAGGGGETIAMFYKQSDLRKYLDWRNKEKK